MSHPSLPLSPPLRVPTQPFLFEATENPLPIADSSSGGPLAPSQEADGSVPVPWNRAAS